MNKLPDPILITGCARSGTSLIAGIVNMCGAFGGIMAGANRHNQKGMFENNAIRGMAKEYLHSIGVDPLGQYPLPDLNKLKATPNWREDVENIMISQGWDKKTPFMYKGAKMCLIHPVWNQAFPNAKWIIVRRDTDDIVNSCMKTGFMRAYQNPNVLRAIKKSNPIEGWKYWVEIHLHRFREMIGAGMDIYTIYPEKLIVGRDFSQIKEMIEFLGLQWNDEVYSFIDEKLWKNKNKK